ncbi:MAG TPA: GTPase [Acidimicrobiia bacterium]|nr:GTPase [Acidimicrobiia bacterium]
MVALRHAPELADELSTLARSLESMEFGRGLTELAAERDRLVTAIRTFLIPRSRNPNLPMSVVFAGPTGSGKSTLVNSLSGRDLSPAGFLRPTTSRPLALASPSHADDYDGVGDVVCDVVSGKAPVLEMMTFIDTPDIDSTARQHRVIAETLIDNADVVVFVTSALRYADEVPWQVLRRAESRGAHVVYVLNRVASASSAAVGDFRSLLAAAGFPDDLVVIPEHHLSPEAQRIPSLAVRSLKRSLATIATERAERARAIFDRVCRATVAQAIELVRQTDRVADLETGRADELAVYLVDRIGDLDLTPVGRNLLTPLRDEPTSKEKRRWARSNRMDADTIAQVEKRVSDRLHALVLSDLVEFVRDESGVAPQPQVFDQAVASTVQRWVGYVHRVADEASRVRGLAEAALFGAACSGHEVSPEVVAVFGDSSLAVVERARRELLGLLNVLYGQTASDLIASAGSEVGCPDDIHAVIGAVSVSLAPVDA